MDYNDNDFQSQNIRLAGEGSNKFPPILRPFDLPKFDFDDNLHVPLRFDSLVETEGFLGIEANEDNQWIEDYSRGGGGIQYSSSTAESCSISRFNNIWSEATSAETVELLLKSVGQTEIVPALNNLKSDSCDELGCIIKQMETQDNNVLSKPETMAGLQPTIPADDITECSALLGNDAAEQPQVVNILDASTGGGYVDGRIDHPTSTSANHNQNDEPDQTFRDRSEESSASEMQFNNAIAEKCNDDDSSGQCHETANDNIHVVVTDEDKHGVELQSLIQEVPAHNQNLDQDMVKDGSLNSDNPSYSSSEKLTEPANTTLYNIDAPSSTIPSEDPGSHGDSRNGNQSQLNKPEVPLLGTQSQGIEDQTVLQQGEKNVLNESGTYILSVEVSKPSAHVLDGQCSSYVTGSSRSTVVEYSIPSVIEVNAEDKRGMQLPSSSSMDIQDVGSLESGTGAGSLSSGASGNVKGQVVPTLEPDGAAAANESVSGSVAAGGAVAYSNDNESMPDAKACETGKQSEPEAAETNKAILGGLKKTESHIIVGESSSNKGDGISALAQENVGNTTPVKDNFDNLYGRNEAVNNKEMLEHVSPIMEGSCQDASEKVSVETEAQIVSTDASSNPITTTTRDEYVENSVNIEKPAESSPAIAMPSELPKKESKKEGSKELSGKDAPLPELTNCATGKVTSGSQDTKLNASDKEKFCTFEASPPADLSQKEVPLQKEPAKKQNPDSDSLKNKVDGSSATTGLDAKIAQEVLPPTPVVPSVAKVQSSRKTSSEHKPRRASCKATGKETAKKGEETPLGLKRSDKITNVSASPSGVLPFVISNERQRYDTGFFKPVVLAPSTSSLPDLNSSTISSAILQQPFSNIQQVQLRAQIFVYGALIQGIAPDEASMLSAFGEPDGGRTIWEKPWRTCLERIHSQKSHILTPETPLQTGARAFDQAKLSAQESKVSPSPFVQAPNKGTPSTASSMLPFSSPLWNMPTPSGDTSQSNAFPRGPAFDFQHAVSPLHSHQVLPVRNVVGQNPLWASQAPFSAAWAATSQVSVLDPSGHFPFQLPVAEATLVTPIKDPSAPHPSGVKHVTAGAITPSGAGAGVFVGSAPVVEAHKLTASSSQPTADTKPRKRKKASTHENILQPQSTIHLAPGPAAAGHLSSSVSVPIPGGLAAIAPIEKSTTSLTGFSSDPKLGNQNMVKGPVLSEETLAKANEASMQAEDATTFSAAALKHSHDLWNQLYKLKNSVPSSDVENKLSLAAVSIAAAAAVAKAAAAAANVAANAALQAKLMADEAMASGLTGNSCSGDIISFGAKHIGTTTLSSIVNSDSGTRNSSSFLSSAKEAARRKVEAASAASKQAENMNAIIKAAELAAEAVSQAGKIVSMGDPLTLSELIAAGPEGYWKASDGCASKSNEAAGKGNLNVGSVEGCPDSSARNFNQVPSDKMGLSAGKWGKSTEAKDIAQEDVGVVDDVAGSGSASAKDTLQSSGKSGNEYHSGSQSLIIAQDEHEKLAVNPEEDTIKEGSLVEVFKDGSGFKAAWFSANVLSLHDEKAFVHYNELRAAESSDKLKEWVPLNSGGDKAPIVRVARLTTALPPAGTRKRRRAAMGDYNWSVGDRVDAWIQDSWWEGVVTEKSKKGATTLSVHFPVQGETSVVKVWHLRPSRIWKDGKWIDWSSSNEDNRSSPGGDTPQEKRPKVRSRVVEAKGKDETSKSVDATGSDKPAEPTLLDLAADGKLFNIGRSTTDEKQTGALRMTRTGLKKDGSRVIFGVPKPGKKRKLMEVSKHYNEVRGSKMVEVNDSVKSSKPLVPQGLGSHGWGATTRTKTNEKRAATSNPNTVKSTRPQNTSGKAVSKDNQSSTAASAPADDSKNKDSMENSSVAEGPIVFSSQALPSSSISRRVPTSHGKPERASKGKLAPAVGKLGKIEEDKVLNGNSVKPTSDVSEPRRSNRRIQPTSRLLEGLQSSLMVAKIPSVSHDKGKRSSRGNHG